MRVQCVISKQADYRLIDVWTGNKRKTDVEYTYYCLERTFMWVCIIVYNISMTSFERIPMVILFDWLTIDVVQGYCFIAYIINSLRDASLDLRVG